MILIFDTETTGLPPRQADVTDTDAWTHCRLVEIAWRLYTPDGDLVENCSVIVRPDGFDIPETCARIHGITTEYAQAHGAPLADALAALRAVSSAAHTLVAHNINFDIRVVASEIARLGQADFLEEWLAKRRECTMLMGTLPNGRWPKLIDLYRRLFNQDPDGLLHRADVDTAACARIYFHLKQ